MLEDRSPAWLITTDGLVPAPPSRREIVIMTATVDEATTVSTMEEVADHLGEAGTVLLGDHFLNRGDPVLLVPMKPEPKPKRPRGMTPTDPVRIETFIIEEETKVRSNRDFVLWLANASLPTMTNDVYEETKRVTARVREAFEDRALFVSLVPMRSE